MQKGIIAISIFLFFFGLYKIMISNEDRENQQKSFQQPGLGLEATVTKVIRKKERANYHLEQMQCADCHGESPKIGKDTRETVKLVIEDVNILCDKCHEGQNLHPIAINLDSSKMNIPDFLPLSSRDKNKGKVTCTTCHAVHAQDAHNYLLRGFPLNTKDANESILESERGIFFKERKNLCMACHDKEFLEKNPHNRQTTLCKFCHIQDPKEATDIAETFNRDIVKLCNFCHSKTRDAHYLAVNPFYDKDLRKEMAEYKIVLLDGKTVCVSCHDPHGGSKLPYALRENYVKLAEKSRRINPHWTGSFCLSCHEKTDETLGFKFNGDYNAICNWCHESKEARGNIHPVGNVPQIKEGLKMPKEYPLQEGRLTCMSCHDVRIQEKLSKDEINANPYFLIGGPFKDMNEMCFKCHIKKRFSEINAHNQITEEGEIKEDNCVYCHTSRPGREVEGIEDIDPTIEDLSYLCIRCHDDSAHPAKVKHLVKMPEDKYKRKLRYESMNNVLYPLDARNRIFCGTCHNVHESGIVKSKRASKGADVSLRVRLPLLKGELCMVCHDKDQEQKIEKDKNENEDVEQ
ncbi:hypothetical protein HZA55_01095 [Candidatus Poribacteria bacterium]|nr:hypothetical protein [Candidatus Poribacteria bacterium]